VRVAALSDFHIGVQWHRDGFRHRLQRFSRWLDHLEASHDRIVLLGDIYQTDHGAIFRRGARRHLIRARERVRELARRFEAPPYLYVFGNHDEIAREVLGATEHVSLRADGIGMFFIHGHQFDPVARRAKLAADLGTWATGRLRAMGLRPVAQWLEGRDISIKDRRFRGEHGPYVRAGRDLARTHDAQIVVMGHTHVASSTPVPEGIVLNTGSCSRGRNQGVSIDTATREVTLLRDDERHVYTVPWPRPK
jgi:predicted phosphodiesterase